MKLHNSTSFFSNKEAFVWYRRVYVRLNDYVSPCWSRGTLSATERLRAVLKFVADRVYNITNRGMAHG